MGKTASHNTTGIEQEYLLASCPKSVFIMSPLFFLLSIDNLIALQKVLLKQEH